MRKELAIFVVLLMIFVLGHVFLDNEGNHSAHEPYEGSRSPATQTTPKAPSVNQVLIKLGSYTSICWEVNGSSLSVFGIQARRVRGCLNHSNGSAVYWIEDVNGRRFPYRVNSTMDEIEWSIVTHTVWPELNIVNFLWWVLENGNVTSVERIGNHYELHASLEYEEESNAGTIEDPYFVKIFERWNVTLILDENGEPIGGHFVGRARGNPNVVGANWFKEGDFTILGEWK